MSCDTYCRGTSHPCFVFPDWDDPDPADDGTQLLASIEQEAGA